MNKKIFLKPLILVVVFAALVLSAFYFLNKYDERSREEAQKHEWDSYVATYRVKYEKDKGGADTPEEAYEAFKSVMLEHNLEKALSYVFIDERDKARFYIEGYLDEGKSYEDIVGFLPKNLEKSWDHECDAMMCANLATAYYEGEYNERGEVYGDQITFVKTFNEKWQIEQF